jgi:hypothetical protein
MSCGDRELDDIRSAEADREAFAVPVLEMRPCR